MSNYGKQYLIGKMNAKKTRIDTRYKFYDMKNIPRALLKNTPVSVQSLMPAFGWCSMAVDAVADRMFFLGFDEDTDTFGMSEIFDNNNPDILADSLIRDCLISSCTFAYVSKDADGEVKIQTIDAGNGTGILDTTTGFLTEGYAVLDTDEYGNVLLDAYFTPEYTDIQNYKDGSTERIDNPTGYCLLVPIVNQPDAKREFGRSVISRTCMNVQDAAARVFLDACIASGIGALPQKYITGLADDVEFDDTFSYAVSRLMYFYKDESGGSPTVGQFPQINIAPYMDAMRLQASVFAGHTGLMVDDLGFVSANPSSVEAIKASHDRLKRKAIRARRSVGSGLLNVGFIAACLRDEAMYRRSQVRKTVPIWEPIDEVDPSTMSIIGDGAIKLNQAVPDFITQKNLARMTGIKGE